VAGEDADRPPRPRLEHAERAVERGGEERLSVLRCGERREPVRVAREEARLAAASALEEREARPRLLGPAGRVPGDGRALGHLAPRSDLEGAEEARRRGLRARVLLVGEGAVVERARDLEPRAPRFVARLVARARRLAGAALRFVRVPLRLLGVALRLERVLLGGRLLLGGERGARLGAAARRAGGAGVLLGALAVRGRDARVLLGALEVLLGRGARRAHEREARGEAGDDDENGPGDGRAHGARRAASALAGVARGGDLALQALARGEELAGAGLRLRERGLEAGELRLGEAEVARRVRRLRVGEARAALAVHGGLVPRPEDARLLQARDRVREVRVDGVPLRPRVAARGLAGGGLGADERRERGARDERALAVLRVAPDRGLELAHRLEALPGRLRERAARDRLELLGHARREDARLAPHRRDQD